MPVLIWSRKSFLFFSHTENYWWRDLICLFSCQRDPVSTSALLLNSWNVQIVPEEVLIDQWEELHHGEGDWALAHAAQGNPHPWSYLYGRGTKGHELVTGLGRSGWWLDLMIPEVLLQPRWFYVKIHDLCIYERL